MKRCAPILLRVGSTQLVLGIRRVDTLEPVLWRALGREPIKDIGELRQVRARILHARLERYSINCNRFQGYF